MRKMVIVVLMVHGLNLAVVIASSDELGYCINNLRQIDGAKEQAALEKKLQTRRGS
jgi:hypothetical protein